MPPRRLLLVIDDDRDIREAIRDLLAVDGYEIAEARDGGAGLAYLRSHPPPGAILLDWNMGPMNGGEFMARFSNDPELSSIPVVLLTADIRAEEKARARGIQSLLKKPIDVDVLLALASRYCDEGTAATP